MRVVAALFAFAVLPSLAAPEEPPVRAKGSVETSILEIDAVVTDRDGKPVPGLRASDFEVKIGGKPVAIENFYERRPAAEASGAVRPPAPADPSAPAAAPAPDAARPSRHVAVFLDRLHLIQKWKSDATFAALRETLRKTVSGPGDDAMLVTWNRAVGTVVPFTPDLAPIESVLAREEKLARQPLEEDTTRRILVDEAAWFQSLPRTSVSSGVEVSARAAAAEAYAQMRAKASAIKAVCAAMGGLPGRKVLVVVSHRFSELAGLEFSLTGPVRYGEIPPDAREFNARGMLEDVARAANANGVTLYTLFPLGWPDEAMVVTADASASSNPKINDPVEGARGDMIVQNEAAAQEPLALATGGTFSLGYKQAPELAERVASDVESSYSLGVAAPARPGKDLAVKVSVRTRGYVVRARKTAVVRSPEERVEARVLSNLFRAEPPSPFAVALDSARVDAAKNKSTATLLLSVPIDRLVRTPTAHGESGAFSVFIASAASDGAFTEVVRRRQPFEIPRSGAAASAGGHFTYEVSVVVGGSEARISVGVWDEVGKDAGFLLVGVKDGRAEVLRP